MKPIISLIVEFSRAFSGVLKLALLLGLGIALIVGFFQLPKQALGVVFLLFTAFGVYSFITVNTDKLIKKP